jgi:hypothetical protein
LGNANDLPGAGRCGKAAAAWSDGQASEEFLAFVDAE